LVGRLIEHEGLMIDEVKDCAGQLAADPEAGGWPTMSPWVKCST
jgi:hypothetical protein